jgi:hypothetical protein
MKLKNVSRKVKHVKIDDEFVSVKPFEVVDLPECLLVNEDGWEEADKKSDDPKKDVHGKYSKTDLVDKTKDEQVKILKDFGVRDEEINGLKTEDQRVAHILKIQNE